jgi:hypothetical protein
MTDAEWERKMVLQGEIRTSEKPRNATNRCVRCYKPARYWSGHVLWNDTGQLRKRVAGWCGNKCMRVRGFYGRVAPAMDME